VYKKKEKVMNKCLKITFGADVPEGFLQNFIQKTAKKFNLEGTVQMIPAEDRIKIVICGPKDKVDQFVDVLHKGSGKAVVDDIEIEPFLKDKDYRGVFRVIE
jgi:acylphosphatase